ncbi:hypothetical protein BCR42DRAFT_402604 [Absidia repens]|uniref:Uncharacterized protein n=1 Tax=Absidia repens TaxID=90262 RepID=A0A1X2IYE4_9FUNG|nr:hypothetical protein BCR42DRAFT_402604 [Absidia repens]
MSFPPNNNNINDDPHSELELLEGLLNNMFSGATSMIFQTLQEPFLNDVEQQQQHGSYSPIMEDLDGSDFRRIAEKKRQRRQQQEGESDFNEKQNSSITRQGGNSSVFAPVNHPSQHENIRSISNHDSAIGNGLGGIVAALLGDFDPSTHPAGHENDNNQGWAFTSSSTSQRRTVRPDGTEETVITTKRNGRTETVTTIKHPDGTIQETRNIGEQPSILSLISSSVSSAPTQPALSNGDDNTSPSSSTSSSTNNPLTRLFRSIWG